MELYIEQGVLYKLGVMELDIEQCVLYNLGVIQTSHCEMEQGVLHNLTRHFE